MQVLRFTVLKKVNSSPLCSVTNISHGEKEECWRSIYTGRMIQCKDAGCDNILVI